MTWSLKLTEDGDLALGGSALGKVANEEKLIQDLRCELIQEKGSDFINPTYGSDLNEEIASDLMFTQSASGYQVDEVSLHIESAIADVIRRYQQRQLSRAMSDKMSRGTATLTTREVVVNFDIQDVIQNETNVSVIIDITTAKTAPDRYPVKLTIDL
jgi:hypothetical protein